jgi:polygalacturonase
MKRLFSILALILGLMLAVSSQLSAQSMAAPGALNVTSFGAIPDGKTKCTEAVRQAIAAATAKGGGTIYFPAGVFLTGPIHLQSHITLYLEAGCVLKFSTDFDDYLPMVPSRLEGIEATNFSPLIYAQNAVDIAIQGRGTLDGQGAPWWRESERMAGDEGRPNKYEQEFKRLNPHPLVAKSAKNFEIGFLRPPFIQPWHCTNVLIENVTIINSPFWTVTPVYCENVTIEAVVIRNPISPNTDGINPDSCRNVHIANCQISVGDDCITIKSGRDADGRRVGRPAENYTIVNCTMANGHGGVVIGSESSGGVRNITIANCVFDGTDRGIRIKSARGRGGVVEDIRVSNIVMRHINYEALLITAFYQSSQPEPVSERTPIFRNIHISGVTGEANIAASFTGLVEMPLQDISLSDIHLNATTGISMKDVKNMSLHNVVINPTKGSVLIADQTEGLELDSVSTTVSNDAIPFVFHNVKNVFIHGCSAPPSDLPRYVQTSASVEHGFVLEGNNFGTAKISVGK